MPTLNVNIPRFYCLPRKEFLYDGQAHHVQWFCPAFVTPFTEKPDYVTNADVWKVERETETTAGFFYDDVDRANQPSQVRLFVKGLRAP